MAAQDAELGTRVAGDFRLAGLPAREVALLELVETLTVAPFEVGDAAWRALLGHGWSGREIARAALGCAHFNYLNRMADGLGIQLDYPVSAGLPGGPAGRSHPVADPGSPGPVGRPAGDPAVVAELTAGRTVDDAPELFAALAFLPDAARLIQRWREYHLTGTAALPATLRARIAVRAAELARAPASRRWAAARAARLGVGPAELAPLPAAEREIFDHVDRLTTSPSAIARADVDRLLGAGLTERDLLQLTMLVAYLSFEHRAAFALGVAA